MEAESPQAGSHAGLDGYQKRYVALLKKSKDNNRTDRDRSLSIIAMDQMLCACGIACRSETACTHVEQLRDINTLELGKQNFLFLWL